MKRYLALILIGLSLMLSGCGNPEDMSAAEQPAEIPSASRDVFAMDTYMTVTCYGTQCEAAVDAAAEEIVRLDELLSVGSPQSEIFGVNTSGSGVVSEDTAMMIEKSIALYGETNGAFDITVYPLMELWGFTSGNYAVPDEAELARVLGAVGSNKLAYDTDTRELHLSPGQGIDLGGIAKGFTSDRIMEIFADYGIASGIVSLGGNVQLYGAKSDGTDWRIGVQDPYAGDEGGTLMGVLTARDCAVITSGAYERYFVDEDGTAYHHILDPKTGYPANNGLISVTIVSPSGVLADGLSTACYVMGLDAAAEYWRSSAESFDMILMTDTGDVYITEPLSNCFTTDYPLHIIEEDTNA